MRAAEKLISDYRATWEQVIRDHAPVTKLDRFFNLPCLMVSLDGEPELYQSRDRITAFNRSRLDAFRAGGVQNAALRGVDMTNQGPHLTLAVVNWELTRADGSLERAWRHYYTILERADAPTIMVSAFQTGA